MAKDKDKDNDKSCFIIVPITTPEFMIDKYRDGKDHFRHVLDCLLVPSVEKAGYQPKPPIAKGSDLIHAEIISNLETADLVLCDMSCLNPNVFFEFGIRTSLNKPVCVVKDELTQKVPFDTALLNYQEYDSSLDPWELEAEVAKLAKHVQASAERSEGQNTLWRYFGMKSEATPLPPATDTDAKLDYLKLEMESLREAIGSLRDTGVFIGTLEDPDLNEVRALVQILLPSGVLINEIRFLMQNILIYFTGEVSPGSRRIIEHSLLRRFPAVERVMFVSGEPSSQ